MKKSLKLIGIMLVGALLLFTGCGTEDDIDKIISASEKMDNVKADVLLEMGMKSGDMSFDINMNMNMEINNKSSFTKLNMSFMGETFTSEEYAVVEDNKRISYAKDSDSDTWVKSEEDYKVETSDTEFSRYLKDYKNVEKITDEDLTSGTKGYKITITKETAMEMLNSNGEDAVSDGMEITGDLILKVYVNKDYQMEKMVLDFKDAIASPEESVEITKLVMTFNFKDYGKVGKITVPEEALNAK